ncbi:hypothetical protein CONLIGDRAFT_245722 [Coniochaeta ligniaria NRRL 30616]|uniref:Uncharacterized protein n=1 Tax=Coniochaeta ligniaria NRRL 30616 TaxID=1408157 RepID=A0A1J7IX87_9PEZI|nr:hypothetical protein CONLIGDRAFT_245722 [Coniochaeta ligniaria NRRL 30616]
MDRLGFLLPSSCPPGHSQPQARDHRWSCSSSGADHLPRTAGYLEIKDAPVPKAGSKHPNCWLWMQPRLMRAIAYCGTGTCGHGFRAAIARAWQRPQSLACRSPELGAEERRVMSTVHGTPNQANLPPRNCRPTTRTRSMKKSCSKTPVTADHASREPSCRVSKLAARTATTAAPSYLCVVWVCDCVGLARRGSLIKSAGSYVPLYLSL